MNNEFDICRTQVAKDCVGAYLNFRFSTQELMHRVAGFFANDDPTTKSCNRPLYSMVCPKKVDMQINYESTPEEIYGAYEARKHELGTVENAEVRNALLEELENAYSILSVPEKKEAYDKFGVSPQEISIEWSKQVHKFAMEIALSWDRNDPPGASIRVLHVLKDVADGSMTYVIISFILVLYLTGLGWIAAIAPGAFMQVLIGVLQWIGVAGSVIEHITNLGTTLTKMTLHGTDILNKTVQKDYGKDIADKLFQTKPKLVDYLDTVLVVLKKVSKDQLENMDFDSIEQQVYETFQKDINTLVHDFLSKRHQVVAASKENKDFTDIKVMWCSKVFIDTYSKPFLHGKISRSIFYTVLSELVYCEMRDDPTIFYPIVKSTVETIQQLKKHPFIPLFVMAEGRDKYSTGAWVRYFESIDWNQYNQLKEVIENRVHWRSYEHQKDYFRVHLRHLKATGLDINAVFPNLTESCSGSGSQSGILSEPSDAQWKTRHLVLYSHGSMSGAIKLLRKFRIKSR